MVVQRLIAQAPKQITSADTLKVVTLRNQDSAAFFGVDEASDAPVACQLYGRHRARGPSPYDEAVQHIVIGRQQQPARAQEGERHDPGLGRAYSTLAGILIATVSSSSGASPVYSPLLPSSPLVRSQTRALAQARRLKLTVEARVPPAPVVRLCPAPMRAVSVGSTVRPRDRRTTPRGRPGEGRWRQRAPRGRPPWLQRRQRPESRTSRSRALLKSPWTSPSATTTVSSNDGWWILAPRQEHSVTAAL
jgi:hypothetical protein